jgi:hypothetical protein
MPDEELGAFPTHDRGINGQDDVDPDLTKANNESCCARLRLGGVVVGLFLFVGCSVALFWNEGRSVRRDKDLNDGKNVVVETTLQDFVNRTAATERFQNKLIHITGPLTSNTTLTDPVFGVSSLGAAGASTPEGAALKLRRSVDMLQWSEQSTTNSNSDGKGSQRTTYSYSSVWSNTLIDSSRFQRRQTPENPKSFPFESWQASADPILLGNRIPLSSAVANRVNWYTNPTTGVDFLPSIASLPIDSTKRQRLEVLNDQHFGKKGYFYHNLNLVSSSNPEIGDCRIAFEIVQPDTVSIVAFYATPGQTLNPYSTDRGGTILFLKRGTFSAAEMFAEAEAENKQLTWLIRVLGFVGMFVSVLLILQPVANFIEILPCGVGDFMAGTMKCCVFPTVAFIITFPLSLLIISLAWVVYRPAIAIPVAVAAFGFLVYGCRQSRRKRNKLQAQQEQQTSSTHIDNYDLHLSQGQQATSVHIGIEPETKAEPDVILYEPYKPEWSK